MTSQDSSGSAENRQERIAALNDQFRKGLGMVAGIPGMVATTAGIAGLPDEKKAEVLEKVREFADFTPDNNPWGEWDFGNFETDVGKIFWKIDYYADENMTLGSEDPSDTSQSYRVLLIMFAHEY